MPLGDRGNRIGRGIEADDDDDDDDESDIWWDPIMFQSSNAYPKANQ